MKNKSKIIILLSLFYLTAYTCYFPHEEKKEIRETLELYHTTLHMLMHTTGAKSKKTTEHELNCLHAKAISLQKKALPISVSLEQRCNNLITAIGELIKAQSTKQNTQLFPID